MPNPLLLSLLAGNALLAGGLLAGAKKYSEKQIKPQEPGIPYQKTSNLQMFNTYTSAQTPQPFIRNINTAQNISSVLNNSPFLGVLRDPENRPDQHIYAIRDADGKTVFTNNLSAYNLQAPQNLSELEKQFKQKFSKPPTSPTNMPINYQFSPQTNTPMTYYRSTVGRPTEFIPNATGSGGGSNVGGFGSNSYQNQINSIIEKMNKIILTGERKSRTKLNALAQQLQAFVELANMENKTNVDMRGQDIASLRNMLDYGATIRGQDIQANKNLLDYQTAMTGHGIQRNYYQDLTSLKNKELEQSGLQSLQSYELNKEQNRINALRANTEANRTALELLALQQKAGMENWKHEKLDDGSVFMYNPANPLQAYFYNPDTREIYPFSPNQQQPQTTQPKQSKRLY